ncbi:MAG: hypothetical protein ACXAC6_16785 [Candidatus Hodarchaeales archaeon]|jgi:hypothetical protein
MFEPDSDDLRTIKSLPFWQAFIGGVLGPVIIAIVFGILGAKTSPLLMQVEIVLVAIAFCLTGILARSKLVGLLSIISAPIAWVVLYLLDTVTGGLIANPFGLITNISAPIAAILESNLIPELADAGSLINTASMIMDLVIVEFLALFLGFFLSMIATGIWTKKGDLSILSVISKPIAAIFVILILVLVPFAYHGVANLAYGGIALAAGATEFTSAFGLTGAGSGAQNGLEFDLNNPNFIGNLTLAAEKAEQWFKDSSVAFSQAQGNFLVNLFIDALFPGNTTLSGIKMQESTKLLDLVDVLALISGGLPELFIGFQNLVGGFEQTFSVLGTTDLGGGFGSSIEEVQADYNPDFADGLDLIGYAIGNFSAARSDVTEALASTKGTISQVLAEGSEIRSLILNITDQFEVGYDVILDIATGGIDFLNATYKTTLAIEELGESDFPGANSWLNDAAGELNQANTTMQNIDSTGLDPNSQLPFWGIVEILKDMTNLLSWFALAAANGTQCYTSIEGVLDTLENLDFSGSEVLNTNWDSFSGNVTAADTILSAAVLNINSATALSNSFETKTYGNIIDDSVKPMLIDFSAMLNSFSSNITEISYLMGGLTGTVNSMQSFTQGFALFNQSYTTAMGTAGGDGPLFFSLILADPDFNSSEDLMNYSKNNASDAWTDIDNATLISSSVKDNWQNILHYPSPPADPDPNATSTSIAGLAQGVIDTIGIFKAAGGLAYDPSFHDLIQAYFVFMDNVDLDSIFGGG